VADLAYTCERCGQRCSGERGSLLVLLRLCSECQAKRYAKGLAEQRRAEVPRG